MYNKRRLIAILLSFVFLQYFAWCNFFVHSHRLTNRIIVHSHPFSNKAHNHSTEETLIISQLSDATCLSQQPLGVPDCAVSVLHTMQDIYVGCRVKGESLLSPALRAPPAVFV